MKKILFSLLLLNLSNIVNAADSAIAQLENDSAIVKLDNGTIAPVSPIDCKLESNDKRHAFIINDAKIEEKEQVLNVSIIWTAGRCDKLIQQDERVGLLTYSTLKQISTSKRIKTHSIKQNENKEVLTEITIPKDMLSEGYMFRLSMVSGFLQGKWNMEILKLQDNSYQLNLEN